MGECRWLIMAGSPIDGYAYYGPFDTETEAHDWALYEVKIEATWWVSPLTPQSAVC
jgi:hypothetical protein